MTLLLDYAALGLIWLAMIMYATLGGADFGGGIWDLFAFGKEKKAEQDLIAQAIGPVWEANNVWIIYLAVGLFTAFPAVAAALSIALFIPFSLALIGIVMRGASFAFRSHTQEAMIARSVWSSGFSIASMITPFLFGTCAGAVATGQIHAPNGNSPAALWGPWLSPFALVIGCMGLGISAVLAATYLTVESRRIQNKKLEDLFRKRAFITGGVTIIIGIIGLALMPSQAPILWHGLISKFYTLAALVMTMLIGLLVGAALFFRYFKLARWLVDLGIAGILGTWGLAQLPYLIPPDLTLTNAVSPPTTLWEFLVSALGGLLILIPSFWFLFHIFKEQTAIPVVHEKEAA